MRKPAPKSEEALVEFRWEVPEQPFTITKCPVDIAYESKRKSADSKSGGKVVWKQKLVKHIVEPYPVGSAGLRCSYNPLEYNPISQADTSGGLRPRLFLDFAALEQTDEKILSFANYCGLLVGDTAMVLPGRKELFWGEPLHLWLQEITAMRFATTLWYAVLEGDRASLEKHVELHEQGDQARLRFEHEGAWGKGGTRHWVRRGGGEEVTGSGRRRPFTLETAAVAGIQKLVRERLEKYVGASFLYQPDREWRLSGSPATRRLPLGLRLVPKNLLGALWLQLAREIDKRVEYRRCAACERRMEISPEARRTNSRTCSVRCRKKLERDRRDRAHTLRAECPPSRNLCRLKR